MASGNKTPAATAQKLASQEKALSLRRAGYSYSEIASEVGISRASAHRLVSEALHDIREAIDNSAGEMRAEEISRLDALVRAVWPQAIAGDFYAIDRALKIMERRAKLLGLDAPTKTAQTDPTGQIDKTPLLWIVPPELPVDEWQQLAQNLTKAH